MRRHAAAALIAVAVLAAAGCGSDDQDPLADPSPTTAIVDQTPVDPVPTTEPPLAGPDAALRDRIYEVGTEIQAGVYSTTVPADHGHPCYWARLRSFGEPDSIIAEGNPTPGETARVTVKSTDRGFKVSNGCEWTRSDPA
ncbi:hypothetical protein GA0074692_6780 [Micromonospora pallida]|uniref:Lipoprotein n=1 Tax=Micromonospora pallida TaxID=145854 RepID=A0A1C6TN22_9ACTN|nr:hypothetical protein [Micromonospora pallida]SCL43138.1 hypothetical protein GA0074692_6729 [Micromonospora pallida]SCL43236.1 hypothetical protein GA0074692_6780 [Micromonospora pallida]